MDITWQKELEYAEMEVQKAKEDVEWHSIMLDSMYTTFLKAKKEELTAPTPTSVHESEFFRSCLSQQRIDRMTEVGKLEQEQAALKNIQEKIMQMQVFSMVLHPRLGASSMAGTLSKEIVQMLLEYL